ncbi:MAG: S-layer homology domain-containing protein, partial [Deltaproteobacteria bacterium]|nr:S-layer homology domain-containing protein [Deltaproteobacteria bacterium]
AIQKSLPIMQLCTPASERKFNGGKLVNRYDMARFIVGLMDRWDLKPKVVLDPKLLQDVPESHPDYEAVQMAVSTGILLGFDGKFHGDKLVNRYQMSVILNRLFEKNGIPSPSPVSEHTFKDVDPTHWAYTAVQDMVSRGILQGFDGKFHGDKLVNRYQMAVIIRKVLQQSPLKQRAKI